MIGDECKLISLMEEHVNQNVMNCHEDYLCYVSCIVDYHNFTGKVNNSCLSYLETLISLYFTVGMLTHKTMLLYKRSGVVGGARTCNILSQCHFLYDTTKKLINFRGFTKTE